MASSRDEASRWKSMENTPLQVPGVPSSQPAANKASARSLRQCEGCGKNQRKVIFVHGSIPVQMGSAVVLMRTTINGAPNVLGMILWTPRGRVDRPATTSAVSLRTIQQPPGMGARHQTAPMSSRCAKRMQSRRGSLCLGGQPRLSFHVRCIEHCSYYSITQPRENIRDTG